ncbi:ABC transporter permease [Bacillus dakarensis]|uniref:ABC transporter permease n=1 Tax=Robertmurraya dakarensis TaxID=1926278 RepID=UPI0009812CA9|nr:ABC transporter permease [Bacillus dakarensis]
MLNYTIRRILLSIPTIFITVSIIFIILRGLPGDPAQVILGETATEQSLQKLREQLGLDLPIWQQYVNYLGDLIKLDFGNSLTTNIPVTEQLLTFFPYTLELTFAAILTCSLIGIPIGIITALKRNTITDHVFRIVGLIGISMPAFFLAIIILLTFALKIPMFPSMGAGEGFVNGLYHLVLPALTLGLIESAIVMRMTRSGMLEEINNDYVRTARAKGLPRKKVVLKHIVRNSLIPVVTVIGLNITTLISGAVITESIFSRPGLGSLAIEAIITRDYPTLQGCLILFCVLVVIVNLLVDISYSYINPRIRFRD